MASKRPKPEEVVTKLRQVEVFVDYGTSELGWLLGSVYGAELLTFDGTFLARDVAAWTAGGIARIFGAVLYLPRHKNT